MTNRMDQWLIDIEALAAMERDIIAAAGVWAAAADGTTQQATARLALESAIRARFPRSTP